MANSTTNSSEKSPSGSPKNKTIFPGFKDQPLDPKEISSMSDEELHRFYKLYGAYIIKDFYISIGAIVTPTRFKMPDLYKRSLAVSRLRNSTEACKKIKIWMDNMHLLNGIVYNRFMRENDENSQDAEEAEKSKECRSDKADSARK